MHLLGTLSALVTQDSEGHGGGTTDTKLMIPGSQDTDAEVGAPWLQEEPLRRKGR